jgi:hypothetical protein
LRIELVRRRSAGERFEEAWPVAVEHALGGGPHREDWRTVLTWSRFAFEDAYARRGTTRLADAAHARELAEVVAEQVGPPAGVGGHRLVA